jgi:hypothetical protein
LRQNRFMSDCFIVIKSYSNSDFWHPQQLQIKKTKMNYYAFQIILLTLGLFAFMLLLLEWGRRKGRRRLEEDGEKASEGDGTVNRAILALMGLLLAFTFSGAATRFDVRRHLIAQEANAIRTAYLRLDILQPSAREPLKELFRRYLDVRLEIYHNFTDEELVNANSSQSAALQAELQAEIWRLAVIACRITTARTVTYKIHPPIIIYAMLILFTLASALLAGFGMAGNKKRNWTHMLAFAATLSFATYVILDLEFPRRGLIRIDQYDQVLIAVRDSMK